MYHLHLLILQRRPIVLYLVIKVLFFHPILALANAVYNADVGQSLVLRLEVAVHRGTGKRLGGVHSQASQTSLSCAATILYNKMSRIRFCLQ